MRSGWRGNSALELDEANWAEFEPLATDNDDVGTIAGVAEDVEIDAQCENELFHEFEATVAANRRSGLGIDTSGGDDDSRGVAAVELLDETVCQCRIGFRRTTACATRGVRTGSLFTSAV